MTRLPKPSEASMLPLTIPAVTVIPSGSNSVARGSATSTNRPS